MKNLTVTLMFVALVACKVERVSLKDMRRIISEQDFKAVKVGMPPNDVIGLAGEPDSKTTAPDEKWTYLVWQGERPGFLRSFLSSKPLKGQLVTGTIRFSEGKVKNIELHDDPAPSRSPSSVVPNENPPPNYALQPARRAGCFGYNLVRAARRPPGG